jgi:hypothetical protein
MTCDVLMFARVRRFRFLLSVVMLSCLYHLPASAQGVGFDRDEFAAPSGARGIVSVDFNRDGWLDLAVANTQPATVAVLLNRGPRGGFILARTVPLAGGPFDIAAGDFDNDGRPDLAVANADGNTIDVLLTMTVTVTTWTSRPTLSLPAPGGPRGVAVADVNGDGALDVAYTSFYQNSVSAFFGDGRGGFSAAMTPVAVGSMPQGIAAVDVNRDGRLELVVANTGSTSFSLLWSNPSGGGYAVQGIAGREPLNVVTIADLNADGWPDIVGAATSRNKLAIYRNGPTGLAYPLSVQTGASPRGVAAGDFNADGRPDLVVANRAASSVTLLTQQADGSFALADELPSGSGARAVAAGDFNHDAKMDFATGNEFAGAISVFRNSPGLPRAAYAFTKNLIGSPDDYSGVGIVVTDVNHNGTPDIVAGFNVILDGDPSRQRTLSIPLPAEVRDTAVLDYNRDGHPDVAILFRHRDFQQNSDFDGYYLFAGDGAGNFTFVSGSGGLSNSVAFEVADMNRDGWDDLAIIGRNPSNFRRSWLYLAINSRSANGWSYRQTLLTGTVYALAIGDVTADGKLDVVLSVQEPNSITVEIGDGNGGFITEAETSISRFPYDIKLTDFDRDGFVDFIVADGPNVHALKGNGQGHYIEKQTFQLSSRPGDDAYTAWADRLIVADVTDDGLPDIVTNLGALLPGNEQGSFGPAEEFEWYWLSGQAADLDADGDLDLVVSDYYGLNVFTNHRVRANQAPIANAGYDGTWSYAYQFDAEEFYLDAGNSTDPDMHRLTFEWRENGKLLGYGRNFWPGRLIPGTHTYELTVRDERGGEAKDTVVWTITHFEEIVMIPTWEETHGTWQHVDDPTAAEGSRLWNPNAGAPKLAAPLANPVHYVDLYFTPDPTLEYKLWIRGKADGNNWANDSIFVQFSDSVDNAGNAVYRIGTSSGLAVNLEECSGCGISGWGWEDDGWGAVNTPGVTLRFPAPQWQRLRIQTREDGFSFDQIVLSARKYKTQRPGTAKNDNTILERTQY